MPIFYDVVQIGDGVAILPFIDDKTLLLAQQYRHPVQETLLELIQGGITREKRDVPGETPEEAAHRELLEETGYDGTMEHLFTFYPLPATLDMKLHIMRATGLQKKQEVCCEFGEYLSVVQLPYEQVFQEVLSGRHKDSALAMTILYHHAKTHT